MFSTTATTQSNGASQSLTPSTSFSSPKKDMAPILFTGGVVLLNIISIGLVAYAYHLRDSFQSQIDIKKKELAAITYTQDIPLQVMDDFSGRVKAVGNIFNNAPSAYSVFSLFEKSAERGVSFGEMRATRVEGTKSYKIEVSGNAKNFDALILQVQTLKTSNFAKYISNVKVNGFTYDPEKGGVTFTMGFMTTVGRFATSNLIIDLTKPDDVQASQSPAPTNSSVITIPANPPKVVQNTAPTAQSPAQSTTATSSKSSLPVDAPLVP